MKLADSCDEARTKVVEDQINYDHLRKLERMFREADVDGGGGLDMDEFRKAMKKIMGNVSDEDINVIFMKVDTNCDGSVDWEEYLNYMLREYRGKDDMQKNKLLPEFQATMKAIPVAHAEEIVKVQFFPNQARALERKAKFRKGGSRSTSGRYLTVSRDGILHYWSDSFKMLRTVQLDQTKRRHSLKLWVIDMLCLANINLMAIASTERDIEFFDIGGNKCDRLFSLVDLDACATAMDYWTDGCKGVFCVGDVKGNILIFTSMDVVMNGLFNVRCYIGGLARVPVQVLMKGKTDSYRNFTVSSLHGDWCQQIMYIPQLNLVASCTRADDSALALTSLPLHNIGKTQSAVIVLKKGVLCFDYSSEMNILVTGGIDPLIRVWNPYVTSSPITQMKGHATAVTHIMINGQRNIIVSISKDKNIRVWDLLDHFCLQSIHGRNVQLGNCPISAAYYYRVGNVLVCTTYTIGLFFGVESLDSTGADPRIHEVPLCCVLYNKNFKQVVSGSHSGQITVWDIMVGQKTMEFPTAEGKPVEITAMAFDAPERRLITGLKNGGVKLWNFNNGACLVDLPCVDKCEVSCVLYLNNKIFVSGWSKRVTWYLDTKEEDKVVECKHWKSYHSDDILSMDSHDSKLLATSSCNGDIVLWHTNSGQAFCRFNASEGPLALLPKREFSVTTDERPIPKDSAKKGVGLQGEINKKCWAYSRKTLLPSRPYSANYATQRRTPGSLCPGDRFKQPQAAWYPGGNERSGNVPQVQNAAEASNAREEAASWKENIGATPIAVEKVLFLKTREQGPRTAILLTSSACGHIYAWTVGKKGGMIGKFRGAHGYARDTMVSTMSTDDKNLVLFTGDSLGYVKIWDIKYYCKPQPAQDGMTEASNNSTPSDNPFYDLIPDYCRIYARALPFGITEQVVDGWAISLAPPPCLSSWRGHLKNVVNIRYVERFRVILTASKDCTIKLWMLSGRHIGTFGQSTWKLGLQPVTPAEVPEEIRRVGSLHTLRVLNEGRQPHWESTRNIVRTLSLQRKEQSFLMDFLHVKSQVGGDTAASKMQELIQKETRMANYTEDQIEAAFQKWEESGKQKSDILGSAYKQKPRRPLLKLLPELKACVANKDQARIYHCIQYTDLHQLAPPQIPDILMEAQQMYGVSEFRTVRKGKKWSTFSGSITKPTIKSLKMHKQVLYGKE